MKARHAGLLLAAAVAAAAVLHFGRAVLPRWWIVDRTLGADTYFLATIYERWAAQIAGGHAPLWFPEFAAGSPIHASWMYGLAYPPTLLFLALPPETAWTGLAILHAAAGALGMFLFLRSEELDDAPAAAGAIVFALSGFLVGRVGAGHLNLVMPLAWAPWVLLATTRCVGGARGGTALLGLCAGLGLVAGHVQVWFYVAPLAALFAIAEMRRLGAARAALARLAFAAALALGVSAIQWIPTYELVRLGGMVSEPPSVVANGSASLRDLAAQFWPRLLEDPASALRHETLGLAGPVGVAAVLAGAFVPGRRRWFWLCVAVLGLVLATGTTNAAGAALNALPPFRFGRVPARAMVLVVIAGAPLAARAVAAFWRGPGWIAPLAFGVSALVALPATEVVRSDFHVHHWTPDLPAGAAAHRVNVTNCRYPFLERSGVRTLRDVCPVATRGWRTFLNDTATPMAWWFDVGTQVEVPWDGVPPPDRAATLALLPRSRVLAFEPGGRASFFATEAAPREPPDIVSRMHRGERVLSVHPSASDDSCRAWAALDTAPVREVPSGSPSALEFEVDAASPGFLFVSETWYPGWESSVDGGPWRDAERANLAFLAVEVPGRARVRLRYAPAWFVPALSVSGAAFAAAALVLVRARGGRDRPGPGPG